MYIDYSAQIARLESDRQVAEDIARMKARRAMFEDLNKLKAEVEMRMITERDLRVRFPHLWLKIG